MATWYTADLHLGHRNIIDYCARPFADAEAMNRALVAGWNDVVADGDEVWVLGDFALGKLATTLPFVGELRGCKILLAGNHDRCWIGHGRRADGWPLGPDAEARIGPLNLRWHSIGGPAIGSSYLISSQM